MIITAIPPLFDAQTGGDVQPHNNHTPKRTGFGDPSEADPQTIVDEINDTPLKIPNQETSNEIRHHELGKLSPE